MIKYIAELVAFVIIVYILVRKVGPRITPMLGKQQELVAQQVQDAETARVQLAEAERAYQNAVTEARTEAAQIRENARAEAQRSVEDIRTAAQDEAERIRVRGEEQLTGQRAAIVRELRAEMGTLALELSEQIVDRRLGDEAQVSATVDAFLAGLEAGQASSSGTTDGKGSGA